MAGDPAVPAQRVVDNVLYDRWLDPLHDLLAEAFKGRARVEFSPRADGGDHYLVLPGEPVREFISRTSDSETSRYRARIDAVRHVGAGKDRLLALRDLSAFLEDLRGELIQNLDRVVGGALVWHDGAVETETLLAATEEDEKAGRMRASLVFAATVTDSI